MEFTETLEQVRADESSVQELFRGDGQRIRSRRSDDPRYKAKLAEAINFVEDVAEGRRPMYHLQEALTTSDFPSLFGDVLDRQLLANYREFPTSYREFVRVSTVPDFRTVKRFALDGGEGQLEAVPEKTEYPAGSVDDKVDSFSVVKYGRRFHLSWETLVNDDLDAFRSLPERLARGARRSEQKFATQLYVDASGPHASLYTGGFANIVTGNPVLSIAALQTAMTVLAAQVDTDGEPIFFETVTLVVPPALEITARNILDALTLEVTEAGGTSGQKVITKNWMAGRVKLVVDPYIPIVASSANGNTMWALFGNPSDGRPALEMGFLRGHDAPALFRKLPDAQRIGGTGVGDDMADFDTDSAQWKVRHVFGGTRLLTTGGAKSTVASQGDGS